MEMEMLEYDEAKDARVCNEAAEDAEAKEKMRILPTLGGLDSTYNTLLL